MIQEQSEGGLTKRQKLLPLDAPASKTGRYCKLEGIPATVTDMINSTENLYLYQIQFLDHSRVWAGVRQQCP